MAALSNAQRSRRARLRRESRRRAIATRPAVLASEVARKAGPEEWTPRGGSRECPACLDWFKAERDGQVYCCKACRPSARPRRVIRAETVER